MSDRVVNRPQVDFDAVAHAYQIEGEDVAGVSSVAKIGGALNAFNIASAWGYRLGYEGAAKLAREIGAAKFTAMSDDEIRESIGERRGAPWHQRDDAGIRGTLVHDVLERLADDGSIPDVSRLYAPAQGHSRSLLQFYLELRPRFIATEVQVASKVHGFAGRYDIRAEIEAKRLLRCIDPIRTDAQAVRVRALAEQGKWALCLLDLKTSKSIYPDTHFPQLEGYEGAGVEMGYPATDFRGVINTNEDGSFTLETDFAISWSTYDQFVHFLYAYRDIKSIHNMDPENLHRAAREAVILAQLPAMSRTIVKLDLPELDGFDSRGIGYILGSMRKRGIVTQDKGIWYRKENDR